MVQSDYTPRKAGLPVDVESDELREISHLSALDLRHGRGALSDPADTPVTLVHERHRIPVLWMDEQVMFYKDPIDGCA